MTTPKKPPSRVQQAREQVMDALYVHATSMMSTHYKQKTERAISRALAVFARAIREEARKG